MRVDCCIGPKKSTGCAYIMQIFHSFRFFSANFSACKFSCTQKWVQYVVNIASLLNKFSKLSQYITYAYLRQNG